MNTRKIIQIATAGDGPYVLHALCDDGSVWVSYLPGHWDRINTTVIESLPPPPLPVPRS
jgi:hypothetical protein